MSSARKALLESEYCFATTAISIALDELGWQLLSWVPETIAIELQRLYGDLPLTTMNRIFAAQTLMTTDFFYKSWPTFVLICNTLFHGNADDSIADLQEIDWAVTEAQILNPQPIPSPGLLSSDVKTYIELAINDAGLLRSPTILKLVGIDYDKTPEAYTAYASDPTFFSALQQNEAALREQYDLDVLNILRRLTVQLNQAGFTTLPENLIEGIVFQE